MTIDQAFHIIKIHQIKNVTDLSDSLSFLLSLKNVYHLTDIFIYHMQNKCFILQELGYKLKLI